MAKKDLIEKAKALGLALSGKETVKQLQTLIETVAPTPEDPTPETETEKQIRERIKAEIEAERPEMPVQEALQKFKEIRKYVSMAGQFRTNLTKEELAEGKKMVKQLNIKM